MSVVTTAKCGEDSPELGLMSWLYHASWHTSASSLYSLFWMVKKCQKQLNQAAPICFSGSLVPKNRGKMKPWCTVTRIAYKTHPHNRTHTDAVSSNMANKHSTFCTTWSGIAISSSLMAASYKVRVRERGERKNTRGGEFENSKYGTIQGKEQKCHFLAENIMSPLSCGKNTNQTHCKTTERSTF